MPDEVQNLSKLFADCIKPLSQIKNYTDINLIQKDLDAFVKWSEDWNMSFNNEKCMFICLGQNKRNIKYA